MSWNNDQHGLVFKSSEIKLYAPSHSYAMKISQIWRQKGMMRIMTYSLPSIAYVHEQLGRRPYGIQIICHEKFHDRAVGIKNKFHEIAIRTSPTMHSKVILIEPKTIYIGSENFGSSGWTETCIGVRSGDAHDWFIDHVFNKCWYAAREVTPS